MTPLRQAILVPVFAALLVASFVPTPATAADVNVTVVAFDVVFHFGSATGASPPTITVTAGDTIHVRVENHDALFHTFTVPHFGKDVGLDNGSASNPTVATVDIPTSSTDVGTWQFWCRPHSSGTEPENHVGMIGSIVVRSPRTPGFEAFTAIAAIATAFALLGIRRARRR